MTLDAPGLPLPGEVRAVIFDVDGTLYDLRPMRRAMMLQLLGYMLTHPWRAMRLRRVIKAFRHAQEALRAEPLRQGGQASMATAQCEWAAREAGVGPEVVQAIIHEWMFERPKPVLARLLDAEVKEVLRTLRSQGRRLGVYSDYPAEGKLEAMGLRDDFDAVISSYDEAVGQFKPGPRGFQVAAETLGVPIEQAVYVGDRLEVDVAGARAAGMSVVLIAPEASLTSHADLPTISSLRALIE